MTLSDPEKGGTVTFDDFARTELGALTRFAGALAGDRQLAEDILSDALLKVAAGGGESRRWVTRPRMCGVSW